MQNKPVNVLPEEAERLPLPTNPIYTLKALLDGVTEENRHAEMNWGPSVGNEFPASETPVISY